MAYSTRAKEQDSTKSVQRHNTTQQMFGFEFKRLDLNSVELNPEELSSEELNSEEMNSEEMNSVVCP